MLTVIVVAILIGVNCKKKTAGTGDAAVNMGIGPITEPVKLEAIDDAMAEAGKTVFLAKCTACHKINEKYIGPNLTGVTKRRAPEWIMNMILNPTEMIQKDPVAIELVMENNMAQMANQQVTQEQARQLLEFFRKNDTGGN